VFHQDPSVVHQSFSRLAAVVSALVLLQASDFSCTTGANAFAPNGIRVTGVVFFLSIEGGCWQLRANNGARYELRPGQAPSKLLVDGAQVTVILDLRTDLVSACQVGQVADVEQVESIRVP
jgi:hypothetical protein